MKKLLRQFHEYWVIRRSGLFDREYYLRNNLDVARECLDPVWHYIRFGAKEGRNPNRNFDTKCFERNYGNEQEINPFAEYITSRKNLAQKNRCIVPRCAYYDSNQVIKNGKNTILLCAHEVTKHLFGAERSFIDIAKSLRQSGYNIAVSLPRYNEEYVCELLKYAYRIYILPYKWWGRADENNQIINEFSNIIEFENISAVHVNTIMIREPLTAARRKKVHSIAHIREIITNDDTLSKVIGKPPEEIVKTVLDRCDFVIANSNSTARAFDKAEKTFIIPNSIDIAEFNIENIISGKIKVALISSDIPKKGIYDFAEVAKKCSHLPNVEFMLIGPDNSYTEKMKQEQKAGAIPANVIFAGYRSRAADAISESNIVVNLSHVSESFGRTVLEAMAAQRPVVVYRHGAIPELVEDGKNGFVVPFKDVDAAAEKIIKLCREPELIRTMGSAGRDIALARYSDTIQAENLAKAYAKIFEEQKQPGNKLICRGKKIRIAYFIWHFPAPSETFVLNELRLLVQNGYEVRVFCRQSPYPDFRPDFDIHWEQVKSAEELSRKLKETNTQIVHSHFVFPTVTQMVWPACEMAKIPFTFIAHAQDIFRYSNDEQNRISEICESAYCERVFVPGKFHKQYLLERNVPERKIFINPQGIDPALYQFDSSMERLAKPVKKVCAIQRYVEKKGLIDLLKCASELAKKGIEINLYGYGLLEDSYKEFIQLNGISNVHLNGAVKGKDELVKVLLEHDLFICPSIRAKDGDMDGIPTILMEAMAVGLPVITTPMASIPELVQDGINGLYCKPGDPESIISAIERYNSMPLERRIALTQDARQTVVKRFNVTRLVDNLIDIWQQRSIDIVLVTWNNLSELQEVVRRIFKYTGINFKLFVCDNNSDSDVQEYLAELARNNPNVKFIHNNVNAFVGPGTNTALNCGISEYAIYICAKEGFVLKKNWEQPLIRYMDENPKTGIAGTLGYSPSYMYGKDYIKNLKAFGKFRNQDFASANPDRFFKHVQGGLFIMRRSMYEQIGGFNQDIPHDYTDVEYSYYAESCGWELGQIPEILSLYIKARPGIFARITEHTSAIHPGNFENVSKLDDIAEAKIVLCNICEWTGTSFTKNGVEEICPRCGSHPEHRSLWRYLAESVLTYRRLAGLYVNPHACLHEKWQQQFQGRIINSKDFVNEIRLKRLSNSDDSLRIIYLNNAQQNENYIDGQVLKEIKRVLSSDGTLLIHSPSEDGDLVYLENIRGIIVNSGFKIVEEKRYSSQVVRFDWSPLIVCKKY